MQCIQECVAVNVHNLLLARLGFQHCCLSIVLDKILVHSYVYAIIAIMAGGGSRASRFWSNEKHRTLEGRPSGTCKLHTIWVHDRWIQDCL